MADGGYSPAPGTVSGNFTYHQRGGWVINEPYRTTNNLARIIFVGVAEELLPFMNQLVTGPWFSFLQNNGNRLPDRAQSHDPEGNLKFEEDGVTPIYEELGNDGFDLDNNDLPDGSPTTIVVEFRLWGTTEAAAVYGSAPNLMMGSAGLVIRNTDRGWDPDQPFTASGSDIFGTATADARIAFNFQKFFASRRKPSMQGPTPRFRSSR